MTQLSNLESDELDVASSEVLLEELLLSLILDSDEKIGATFARVLMSLSNSRGCLLVIAADVMEPGKSLFVGSYGQSEFFVKLNRLGKSRGDQLNNCDLETLLSAHGVDLFDLRSNLIKNVSENSVIYFKPMIESDGRHVGLIALEVSDGGEPLITSTFRAAVTSIVNRTNTHKFLGVKFPPISEVVSGLSHDLRGGLALIGMQNELSRFQGSSPSELSLGRERIAAGVATVELASERLQGFIELLFPPFYAADSCSPISAVYAAIASLPWSQEIKNLVKIEIDHELNRMRIQHSGATVYWVFRTVISFMSDPRRSNKAKNEIKVKLGLDRETDSKISLRCQIPMSAETAAASGWKNKKQDEQIDGFLVMDRVTAFEYWAKRIGFEINTNFDVENGLLTYGVSFKKCD